jgi:hypothetical protein
VEKGKEITQKFTISPGKERKNGEVPDDPLQLYDFSYVYRRVKASETKFGSRKGRGKVLRRLQKGIPLQIKTWGAIAPHAPAIAVTHLIMTCTKRQVGCRSRPLLLPTSAVCQSRGGRSANRKGN